MKETDNVEVADTYQLQRIANALEEILRLVKADQEKMEKARLRERMTLKEMVMTEKEKKLAAHLAAMCCQADEDCPAEYRTEHFRSTMDDAYDYLKEIGYLK